MMNGAASAHSGQHPKARDDEQESLRHELDEIREQIAGLTPKIVSLKSSVDVLSKPKEDVSVPGDIAKSLRLVHGRLDRLESQQKEQDSQIKKATETFSNAILKMADKLEKIAGGEDSKFSLAHSLEKLLTVLQTRKLRIIRDNDGNMVAVETQT